MTGQQLKNSILQMAVQGKLVPQDPNDEPASVLLERIRKEKEQLIKEGKIKKEKNPSYIFRGADNLPYEKVGKNEPVCIADEVPFEIPDSWEWARLKNLTIKEIKRGKSPKYADDGSVYVFAQKCNVKLGGIDVSLAKFLDMKVFDKYPGEEYMADGDIIINSTGNGTLGRIGIFRDSDRINDFVIVPDSHVTIIRTGNQMIKDYLFFALKYHQPYLEKLGEGSTNQTELRPSTVAELFIPVPPIGEQKRIVEKLLEVLPLADVYGIKEKSLQDYNTDFPVQLKKSILQEAVQGKLVPQDPADEPASILLERIRAEKEQLIKAGKIKRDKHESVIFRRDNSHYEKLDGIERCIDDEIPFEIPDNWCWTRLGTMIGVQRGASPRPKGSPEYWSLGRTPHHWIKISDITKYTQNDCLYDTDEFLTDLGATKSVFVDSDYLITAASGSLGKIAKLNISGYIYDGLMCMCFKNTSLEMDYIIILIQAMVEFLMSVSTGTAWKNITTDILKSLLVPLPPLLEQRRIVKKQRELFDAITLI